MKIANYPNITSLLLEYGIVPGDNKPVNILVITDPGKDLDDEQALIAAVGLHHLGLAKLSGTIANLEPAESRAQLAKGTLNMLGFENSMVGIGSDCFRGGQNLKHETSVPYLFESTLPTGQDVFEYLLSLFESDGEQVTIVCNSGLTDAAYFVMNYPDQVKKFVERFVIMGGVKSESRPGSCDLVLTKGPDGKSYIYPDDAANNSFDYPAALYLYQKLQEMGIPMTIVMRSAAYATQFPFSLYDAFAETGNPIGACLLTRQKPSINALWFAANADEGSSIRGKLPISRDRKWFIDVFCKGSDPGISGEAEIWDYVGNYNQYDTIAVVAAIQCLKNRFFKPRLHEVNGVTHEIIGLSTEENGVLDSEKLRDFISELQIQTLSMAQE